MKSTCFYYDHLRMKYERVTLKELELLEDLDKALFGIRTTSEDTEEYWNE